MKVISCYDIPDGRKRERLAKTLESCGDRVQKSVFEVQCASGEDVRKLLQRITKPLMEGVDNVRLYPLCAACEARAYFFGAYAAGWEGLL